MDNINSEEATPSIRSPGCFRSCLKRMKRKMLKDDTKIVKSATNSRDPYVSICEMNRLNGARVRVLKDERCEVL